MNQLWNELRAAIARLNYLQQVIYRLQAEIRDLRQQLRDVRGS